VDESVADLVARALMHDADAFTDLIRRFEGIALSIAYSNTRNAADAGDLVQEAFLRAWQRLDTLEDPSRFGHWLGRMVRNLAIDQRRRKRPGALDAEIDIADPKHRPASMPMELSEQRVIVERAMSSLDELSRTCVTLRYYEGLSSKEIGEMLDVSPAAVDMRLSRARNTLKELLKPIES